MQSIKEYASGVFRFLTGGESDPYNVLLLGLDAAGKTTFMYKHRALTSGFFRPEIVTTIPTIGFNVETVEGKQLRMTCWDVGGCDKIRPLWRHYMQRCGGVLFFIDSNDRDRVDNAKEELDTFLREEQLVGLPLLIVANKCDLPNAMNEHQVITGLGLSGIHDRECRIISTCMTLGTGIQEIDSWLRKACKGERTMTSTSGSLPGLVQSAQPNPSNNTTVKNHETQQPAKPAAVETASTFAAEIAKTKAETDRKQQQMVAQEWTSREDSSEEEFLQQLESYQLDVWDHYTHVRIAWVLLHRHGIQNGYEKVSDVIQRYIRHSTRTDGKSYHATMTRFWCHMIAYCMQLHSWEASGGADRTVEVTFKTFVAWLCARSSAPTTIALWDKTLFKQYYSPAVMFAPAARSAEVQPDLQPLPDLVAVLNSATLADMAAETAYLEAEGYWRLG